MLSTLPNVSLADHKTEDRESKSLWPKELQQRDIKRDEYILERHGIEVWRIPIKDINMSYKQKFMDKILKRVREMELDATT